ncbi:hypothetical protein FNF29_03700 [Cafeteria roenbergensis]|uniref:Uncharacterized protein n=1 Tax=Cafeteria roenbergensis TaxID=33653 RepID=A0A5A8CIC7_CAFRO|nr:hypothetical protein FNF29_03700 [Cafeteria roenbergensis]|eukprot:KAA0152813.1 hypothetical protein FNF29_03700 [Cafeteria roenbergensis]
MSSRVGPLPAWWTDPLAEHLRDDGTLEAGGGDARAVAPRVLELLGVAAGLDSPCIPVTMRAVPPQDWEAVGATTAALVAEGASAAVELASKGRAVAPAELDALPRCESQAPVKAGDAAVPDTIDLFRFRPRGPADWLRSERRYLVRAVVLRHGATGQGAADSGHWTCARAPAQLPAEAFVAILVLESLTPEIDDPEP